MANTTVSQHDSLQHRLKFRAVTPTVNDSTPNLSPTQTSVDEGFFEAAKDCIDELCVSHKHQMRQSQSPRTKVHFSDLPASTTGGTIDSARRVPGSPNRSPPRLVKGNPVARERCCRPGASFVRKQGKTSYSHLKLLDLYRLPGCRCLTAPSKSSTKSAQKATAKPY